LIYEKLAELNVVVVVVSRTRNFPLASARSLHPRNILLADVNCLPFTPSDWPLAQATTNSFLTSSTAFVVAP
jgi:hypothetical protein